MKQTAAEEAEEYMNELHDSYFASEGHRKNPHYFDEFFACKDSEDEIAYWNRYCNRYEATGVLEYDAECEEIWRVAEELANQRKMHKAMRRMKREKRRAERQAEEERKKKEFEKALGPFRDLDEEKLKRQCDEDFDKRQAERLRMKSEDPIEMRLQEIREANGDLEKLRKIKERMDIDELHWQCIEDLMYKNQYHEMKFYEMQRLWREDYSKDPKNKIELDECIARVNEKREDYVKLMNAIPKERNFLETSEFT